MSCQCTEAWHAKNQCDPPLPTTTKKRIQVNCYFHFFFFLIKSLISHLKSEYFLHAMLYVVLETVIK